MWSMNDLKVLRPLGHQLKHLLTPPLLSLHCPSVNNSSCPKAGGGGAFAFLQVDKIMFIRRSSLAFAGIQFLALDNGLD